jgi:hypothetical protein
MTTATRSVLEFTLISPSHWSSLALAFEPKHLVNRMTVEDEWLEPLAIWALLTMVVVCLDFF